MQQSHGESGVQVFKEIWSEANLYFNEAGLSPLAIFSLCKGAVNIGQHGSAWSSFSCLGFLKVSFSSKQT